MRIMGLDYGDKNIGVSLSDPLLLTANGIEVIRRSDQNSLKKSMRRLAELILEYDVGRIVLGYPKNMDDSEGERCQKTLAFRDRLENRFKHVSVVLWDERLSTVAADHVLASLTKSKRDKVVDKVAAVYILQGYLDYLAGAKHLNLDLFDE